jgi:ATP-dependent RNA helicase DeaD
MSHITFAELGLAADTLAAVAHAGYATPTPIQIEAVPALVSGRDVHLQSQTGTGKTAAFVLPLVDRMQPGSPRVETLVLTPTRELAQQVCDEFSKLGSERGLRATAIYGGTSFEKQYKALETARIVVATPGRLLDLHRRGRIDLSFVRYFGLDEADEMLSMGFDRDVLEIAALLPSARQSFLCSATFNEPVLRIAQSITSNPVTISTSSDHVGAQSVRHVYFRVPEGARAEALVRIVAQTGVAGAIVFCNTRAASFRVSELLAADGRNADVLNGDLSQSEREAALARMRAGEVDFLVATDVAARGIDISGLPAVINYDMPDAADVYVHRTGRTGRAGQAGTAYSIVTPGDITVFHALQKNYKLRLEPAVIATREQLQAIRADRMIDALLADLDRDGRLPYAGFLPLADRLRERPDGMRLVAMLFAAWCDRDAPVAAAGLAPSARRAAAAEAAEAAEAAAATAAAAEPAAAQPAPATPDTPASAEAPARAPRGGRRASAAVPHADAAPAPAPAPEPAGVALPVPPATAPPADDPVFAWVVTHTDRRNIGRFLHADAIAADTGLDEAAIVAAADANPDLERARNGDPMWRLRRRALDVYFPREPRPTAPPAEAAASPAPAATGAGNDVSNRADAAPRVRVPAGFAVMRVNVGRDLFADPRDLVRQLIDLSGFDRDDVGRLELAGDHALVPVRAEYCDDFIAALRSEALLGRPLQIEHLQA